MSKKIYVSGNYFIIESEYGSEYPGLAKNVVVRTKDIEAADPTFFFHNVEAWSSNNPVKLSEITDEAGVAYTLASFKEFYEAETGKSSAGSSTAETTRIKGVVIPSTGWVLNDLTGVYEYTYSNASITLSHEVDFHPAKGDMDTVYAANVSPFTTTLSGGVELYAKTAPSVDITVTILIREVSDPQV